MRNCKNINANQGGMIMKKTALYIKLIVLILTLVLFVFVALSMTTNSFITVSFGFFGDSIENIESYTLIEDEAHINDTVTIVDIQNISGKIDVIETDNDFISIEYHNGNEVKAYYKVDGQVLTIKTNYKRGFGINASYEGDITLYIPKNTLLSNININTVSGDSLIDINADQSDIDSVSGNVTVKKPVLSVDVETVSGNIDILVEYSATVDVETVSGNLIYTGIEYDLDFDTVSGDIVGENKQSNIANVNLSFDSVSGDLIVK